MEASNPYDNTQGEVSFGDAFKEEAGENGSGNLNAFIVYSYPTTFLIEPSKATGIESRLLIDKKTGRMKEIGLYDQIPQNFESKITYSAFLGIMHIFDKVFLLLVDKVKPVCKLENNDIFVVTSVAFIPFEDYGNYYQSANGKALLKYIFNFRKIFKQGYYFSFTLDLTISKQKRAENSPSQVRFQWNRFLCKDLIMSQISPKWMLPLIQGYIGYFESDLMGKSIAYYLISRRSSYKAGTRYTVRGLDDEGNVANFTESEQIIYLNGWCCSHIQLRGSAPVFWQQRGVTAQTKITRSFDITNTAFLKHFEDLNKNWGRCLCFNLMSKTKKDEQAITMALEEHMKNNNLPNVRYEFFDFHQEVKGQKFDKINPMIENMTPLIEGFKFFAQNMSTGETKNTQLGAIRTSCLDCLDRTNFFQSKIAVRALSIQLKLMKVPLDQLFGQDPLYEVDNNDANSQHSFLSNFKKVWALNADIISMHYAGTGSVISAVTKTGKRDFMGLIDHGMKTLNRFYNSNFEDQVKQECIDILLGQHTQSVDIFGEELKKILKEREREFAEFQDLNVFAVTWNLGGMPPPSFIDLNNLFNFQNNPVPDIIVIGFQEYFELNAANVMVNQGDARAFQWRDLIYANLKKFGDFVFVKHQSLVGVLILVFANVSIKHRIGSVDTDIVKTGLGGNFGNKGGTLIKLHVDDTSFCFINCHLEAGNKSNNTRLTNILDIHNKAFQQEGVGRRREEKILNMDYRFFLGDMNFRIEYGNFETRHMLEECVNLAGAKKFQDAFRKLDELFKYDQFNLYKNSYSLTNEYQEGVIRFLPTYKYDANSNVYDTSKKQRIPSWTDRIMWSCGNHKLEQMFYTRREYKESDHRPVVAYFVVEVKRVDRVKRDQIKAQIQQNGGTQPIEVPIEEDEDAVRNYYVQDENYQPEQESNVAIKDLVQDINLLDFDEPAPANNQNNQNNASAAHQVVDLL